jgi:hypothetical protein
MNNHSKRLGKVVSIDEAKIHDHFGELARGATEEALNAMLDTEADVFCSAQRYEYSSARVAPPEPASANASFTPRQAQSH